MTDIGLLPIDRYIDISEKISADPIQTHNALNTSMLTGITDVINLNREHSTRHSSHRSSFPHECPNANTQ